MGGWKDLISYAEENYISTFGFGFGLYPEKLENNLSKCLRSSKQNNLLNALPVFFGN